MNYYLVGLFDDASYIHFESIQNDLSKQFNLYNDLPMLHITLEVITEPDLNLLDSVLKDILKKYKQFQIQINGAICFDPPFKSVNLKVENNQYIDSLCKEINYTLKEKGFKVRDNIEDWDLHISLANTNFSSREWSDLEYLTACDITKNKHYSYKSTIEKIELWKPVNDKSEMIIDTYNLEP